MRAQVPAGSLPRTMEVIFRNDIVEQARAGDKLVFSGSLVVVPDVSVITAPGQRSLLKGAGAPLSLLTMCCEALRSQVLTSLECAPVASWSSRTSLSSPRPASAAFSRAQVAPPASDPLNTDQAP